MAVDITVKIGGQAGQGIQTVGDLLCQTCRQAGYFFLAINDYESRVRGGHNFFQVRISDTPVLAPAQEVDLLVDLDGVTYTQHASELNDDAIVLCMPEQNPAGHRTLHIDFTGLAKEAGNKAAQNTVAAAACLALLGAGKELCSKVVSQLFGTEEEKIVTVNQKALQAGFERVAQSDLKGWNLTWKEQQPAGALFDGASALALGAVAAGCRVGAFYPMSPATGIMTHLVQLAEHFPLVVEQAEDEIAAVNMVIGANFAGCRALTATSGGGFSLMTEGIGLAATTETPLVLINAQRPGPATGLPTRTGQGDLLFTLHASQDEFPRFVLAPATVADCFYTIQRAFYLADTYQVPVMVLVDQYLVSTSMLVAEKLEINPAAIPASMPKPPAKPETYARFAFTENGISPRLFPCQSQALVKATGNEHTPDGHSSENRENRIAMVNKRLAKLPSMKQEQRPPLLHHEQADWLLVSWGSSYGMVYEAVGKLRSQGLDVGLAHLVDIWPLPQEPLQSLLSGSKWILVEQNATGQLGWMLRAELGVEPKSSILQYDGRPLEVARIVSETAAKIGG
ncbi:MAG: 2-oxoacid:acceptor oxidoreductase subunit alpha [Desulfuromonadaceae bacterium]|nr:2-oxoacid:acceptor oxidoreductase subunit alpha [Desulfuromonas sp.]MDY0184297.1 2-oxoacid:acceptor oxidoreductase subunit alpha [Desulfuromonadaceae bacterium]